MSGWTGGPGGAPGPARASDATGALELEAVPHPSGTVLLHATGEIDTVTAPFLVEQLRAWFAVAPRVVLNLSRVVFLGSAGLSALVAAGAQARDAGAHLQLSCGEARHVRRVLQVTGTLRHLDVLDPVPPRTAGRRAPLYAVPDLRDDRPPSGDARRSSAEGTHRTRRDG